MNEAKIAVTIAALLITGAFGSYAFKNLDTDDIVTDKITTVETVREVTAEEDLAEVETVELTDNTDDTQAKKIYLERSQSSIRSKVVHIESDDCVYADAEPAVEAEQTDEPEIGLTESKAEEIKNDESKAQTPVYDNSEAEQTTEQEKIPVRYDVFNADAADIWSDDSSEAEEDSSLEETDDSESDIEADESSADPSSDELGEDETSSYIDTEESEEESADSFGESESTENTEEITESSEAPVYDEEEESDADDESSESEAASEDEENAEDGEDEEEEQTEEPETSTGITVTESEYYMLCNVVAHEYGSDWVSEYDKALVVEVIMNRVNSPKYPNSIYAVLTQPYQFSGMQSYITLGGFSSQVTDSVKAAVDLYLSDPSQFNHGYFGFWGDGRQNHFY